MHTGFSFENIIRSVFSFGPFVFLLLAGIALCIVHFQQQTRRAVLILIGLGLMTVSRVLLLPSILMPLMEWVNSSGRSEPARHSLLISLLGLPSLMGQLLILFAAFRAHPPVDGPHDADAMS